MTLEAQTLGSQANLVNRFLAGNISTPHAGMTRERGEDLGQEG